MLLSEAKCVKCGSRALSPIPEKDRIFCSSCGHEGEAIEIYRKIKQEEENGKEK